MAFEAPKKSDEEQIDEQLALMDDIDELEAFEQLLVEQRDEKQTEIAGLARDAAESVVQIKAIEDQMVALTDELAQLKEEIRLGKEATASASAGTGPTGVPPSTADEMEEALRQARAAAASHAGETAPGPGDPAATDEKYEWGRGEEAEVDPKSWEEKPSNFFGNEGWLPNAGVNLFNKYQWLRVVVGLPAKILSKITAVASFTTTPIEFFFHSGMRDAERRALAEVITAAQKEIKDQLTKDGGPKDEGETAITGKIHAIETTIEGMAYVPQEWKKALVDRLKLLLEDYRKNEQWEDDRYAKEIARIIGEYVVSKSTKTELAADAASTVFVAGSAMFPALLAARGISSAGFSYYIRYTKETHAFERTHWKEKRRLEADEYELERAKVAAWDKVLKKCSYEWAQGIGSVASTKFFSGGLNPLRNRFWKEKISFVQSLSTLARAVGIGSAAAHLSDTDIVPTVDKILHAYEQHGGAGNAVLAGFYHNAEHAIALPRKIFKWAFGNEPSTVPVVSAPIHHEPTPVAPHPIEQIDAPPKVLFTMRSIHSLRDLGYVNKSSEPFVNDRVRMYEVDGVRFETRVVEQLDSHGDRVKLPQIISINNRNVEAIDITSEKQFYQTLNDPDQYSVPLDTPVNNVKFNYWIEHTSHGNEFHRFWQRDGIDYEIKGTSVYQDIETKEFYTLPPGHTVHHKYDELQNIMKYNVVGVRMDGVYHSVNVPLNHPIHGDADPNVGFAKFHKSVGSGRINLNSIKAPRLAPPTGETPPFDPKTIGKPDPVVVAPATPPPPIAAPIEKKIVVPPVILKEPIPAPPAAGPVATKSVEAVKIATPATIAEPLKPTETSATPTVVETPPTPIAPPAIPPAPAQIIPAPKAAPIQFGTPGEGRQVDPSGPRSDSRSFSGSSAHNAIGRGGRGAPPIDFSGGHTERRQPYEGKFVDPGRQVDPTGPIGKDLKEALAAQEAAGQLSASSSGRIAQKIFDREFLTQHGMKPGQLTDAQVSQLQNLKENARLLLEGKNIKGGDSVGITQDDFHKAMGVNHVGNTWLVEIKDEAQWKSVLNKLLERAQHHFPEHSTQAPHIEDTPSQGGSGASMLESHAPKNLPVSNGAHIEIPQPSVDESIGRILKNTGLTAHGRFREVSNVIEHMEKGRFTLHTPEGEITIAKLGNGPGAFIKLPDEESSRFWSPKTAAAIEKLLRK